MPDPPHHPFSAHPPLDPSTPFAYDGGRAITPGWRRADGMPGEHLTNLPARRTALIGRDEDLAALHDLTLHTQGRLVTLTGAGGCGKTSLALDLARWLLGDFPDGAWFVGLAPLSAPALVPQAV